MAERTAGLPLEEPGLWVERIGDRSWPTGKAALFLDRDGTINVDTGYPSEPASVVLRDDIVPAIEMANRAGIPVVVVTNQSGIARGYFGWEAFAAVNRRVLELLLERRCFVDLVIACGYHDTGIAPFAVAGHPMRKPNPGMFFRAAELFGLDLHRSIVVGDKPSDMEAGRRAGLSGGWLIGGEVLDFADFPVGALRNAGDALALLDAIAEIGKG